MLFHRQISLNWFLLCLVISADVNAVTDNELESLEQQIEQQEAENKKQALEETKRKIEAEEKRKVEQARQAELERKRVEEERRKTEEYRLEKLELQRQEEESRKKVEEEKEKEYNQLIKEAEQALNNKDKELAIRKYKNALELYPDNNLAKLGLTRASNLKTLDLEKDFYINNTIPECDNSGSPLPKAVPLKNNKELFNLSLLKSTRVTASSVIKGYPGRHSINNLIDGWYNNCRSWIPAKRPPAWIEIDLGDEYLIYSIVFGSEQPYYKDRAITRFRALVSINENVDWKLIYTYKNTIAPIRNTTIFEFNAVKARFIKIEILDSVQGAPRIDEIEIYGDY